MESEATSAKEEFWKRLTRERWSTLPYFLEILSKKGDLPCAKILKIELEYRAAKEAYDTLAERDKAVLIKRCVDGLSFEEIATQGDTGCGEVAETLRHARKRFYDTFLSKMYLLHKRDGPNEDDSSDAWAILQGRLYKFIPENFTAWLGSSTKRVKIARKKRDETLGRIAEKNRDPDRDPELDNEGKPINVAISGSEWQEPRDEIIKDEAEERETRYWKNQVERWHRLFQNTACAILECKKPQKKLYLLVNYFLQPQLNELRELNNRGTSRFQDPSNAITLDHAKSLYLSKKDTQKWIAQPIDESDRTIRRYAGEIIPLVERYAKEVGISREDLIAGCAPIKKWWDTEKQSR